MEALKVINPDEVIKLSVRVTKCTGHVLMASASLTGEILGYCHIVFSLNNTLYSNVKVLVLCNLCIN